jgi:hypothetical protein
MTPATSVSFYKPVFSDFLYAQVDEGWNGNPLSVLPAFARLNVDPWMEAAELAELPEESARRRLAELLERLPSRPWTRTESGPIADRPLKLLPHSSPSEAPQKQLGHGILHVTSIPGGNRTTTLTTRFVPLHLTQQPSTRGVVAWGPGGASAMPSCRLDSSSRRGIHPLGCIIELRQRREI